MYIISARLEKVHNEKFHNLYSTPNTIRMTTPRRMREAGHVAHIGQMRKAYTFMVQKSVGKRPPKRSRHR
jgi:hypothetical protein